MRVLDGHADRDLADGLGSSSVDGRERIGPRRIHVHDRRLRSRVRRHRRSALRQRRAGGLDVGKTRRGRRVVLCLRLRDRGLSRRRRDDRRRRRGATRARAIRRFAARLQHLLA